MYIGTVNDCGDTPLDVALEVKDPGVMKVLSKSSRMKGQIERLDQDQKDLLMGVRWR